MSFLSKFFGGGDKGKTKTKSPADRMMAKRKGKPSFPGLRAATDKYGESMRGAADYNTRKKEDTKARKMPKADAKKFKESERQKRISKTAAAQNSVKQNKAKSDYKEAPTGGKQTKKAGFYPSFKKKSKTAGDFRSAFAAARKANKKEFTWKGRKYSTKVK